MPHLRDSPLVKVNRKLKDRGGRATGLVDWSWDGLPGRDDFTSFYREGGTSSLDATSGMPFKLHRTKAEVPEDELLTRTSSWINQDAPQQARRAAGALLGLAVADWVGAPLEFLEVTDDPGESRWDHDSFHCHNPNTTEIERGILKPGQWTDDTSMALCLADSLCICGQLDGSDLRKRFWCWHAEAMNTPWRLDPDRKKRTSFGLGYNIAKSLIALYPDEPIDPEYLNPGSSDSGNGGLMRLAPVPIFYSRPEQLEEALDAAARSSLATHPGVLATETARYLAFLVHSAINRQAQCTKHPQGQCKGQDLSNERVKDAVSRRRVECSPGQHFKHQSALKEEMSAREFFIQQSAVYAARLGERLAEDPECHSSADLREIQALATSSKEGPMERCWNWQEPSLELLQTFRARGEKYNGHPVSRCYAGSYCMDGLAMALHAVASTESFHRAIEKAVNFLGDADTVGAIAGQLAGAFYGLEGIDPRYTAAVHKWDRGEILCRAVLCYLLGDCPKLCNDVVPADFSSQTSHALPACAAEGGGVMGALLCSDCSHAPEDVPAQNLSDSKGASRPVAPSGASKFLTQVKLFQRLPESELPTLAMACEPKTFRSGDKVITEGDVGDAFYIIRSGDASCQHSQHWCCCYADVTRMGRGRKPGERMPVVALHKKAERQ
ncbi:tri1 [Symbiodinium sp. CCMP2592]|nr:tri1 [Symbiodinium sp. CCMP2592]